jgi:cell division protein YceG involved in septum cleavage
MLCRFIATGALVATLAAGAAAAATPPSPSLGVLFAEGMTARQMTDRVSAVRRIAISKRHVRPVLTAKSYAAALTQVAPPRAFAGAKRGRLEGFLFPSLYKFGASTTATELVGQQLAAFDGAWSKIDLSPPLAGAG